MEQSNKHQGELSLLEKFQNLKSPDGRRTPDSPGFTGPPAITIALNEERLRRKECEKIIQQLQSQVSVLQQNRVDSAVAEAAMERKDSLLLEAQRKWDELEADWHIQLSIKDSENKSLVLTVTELKEKLEASTKESKMYASELVTLKQKSEEIGISFSEEISKHEARMRELKEQLDVSEKEVKRIESKLDESKRENRRLKNQIEDLKREKCNSEAEVQLLQERFENSRVQWEAHCQSRIKEATANAEEQAERRFKGWHKDIEGKLQHMASSVEFQLQALKAKSFEEMEALKAQHQAEMQKMRNHNILLFEQNQQQKKEMDDLTRQMREQVEAQWNTVNRIQSSSGSRPFAASATSCEMPDINNFPTTGNGLTQIASKREVVHQYVNQVKQQTAPPPSKAANEHRNPAPKRKL